MVSELRAIHGSVPLVKVALFATGFFVVVGVKEKGGGEVACCAPVLLFLLTAKENVTNTVTDRITLITIASVMIAVCILINCYTKRQLSVFIMQ